VFNNAAIGNDTVTNFHPSTDLLQFSSNAVIHTAQDLLAATQDDIHGNAVITLDAQDTVTLNGVHTAQLHLNDFHIL
jgi:hypothetical protein